MGEALKMVLQGDYKEFMQNELGTTAATLNKFREMTLDEFMDEFAKNQKLWEPFRLRANLS